MTAIEIYEKKTGDIESSDLYVTLAESTIREYLGYTDDKPIDRFAVSIAKVAEYMKKKADAEEKATTAAASLCGAKSESFSEGGVSVSKTYESVSEVLKSYDDMITSVLAGLNRYRTGRVIKGACRYGPDEE